MKWLEEIESRATLVPNHTGAWADVRKLITAVRLVEDALGAIRDYWNGGYESAVDACEFVRDEADEALAQLQSGEFPKGELS